MAFSTKPDDKTVGLAEDVVRVIYEQLEERARCQQDGRLTLHLNFDRTGQLRDVDILPGSTLRRK